MENQEIEGLSRLKYLSELFVRSTRTVEEEIDTELTATDGPPPESLKGELFRNGPGRFSMGSDRYQHPFDGDGMISKFTFNGTSIRYQNKYVRTREFMEEQKKGRMLYRGFGTNIPGGLKKNIARTDFKNAANTNVVRCGKKLLALWEGGWPHELDSKTLETISRYNFSGRLNNDFGVIDARINPELPFSAHPKIDPATGVMYNFGTVFGTKNRLLFYTMSPSGSMVTRRHLDLDGLSFVHDFTITSKGQAIFFCSPVQFDILSMISGLKSPAEGMRGDHTKTVQVITFPLDGPDGEIPKREISTYELPFSFVFHHINAFEAGEEIFVYSSEMESFPDANEARNALEGKKIGYPVTQLVRYSFNKKTKKSLRTPLGYSAFELPRVRESMIGKEFGDFLVASSETSEEFPFLTCIDRVDVQGKVLARRKFEHSLVGEPIFTSTGPKSEEYVCSLVFNGEAMKSDLVLMRLFDLQVFTQARLPHSHPVGFHGNWYPSYG